MKKLTLKTKVEISVGANDVEMPIEIDLEDIVDLIDKSSDSFKKEILEAILGVRDHDKRDKVAKMIYQINNHVFLFKDIIMYKTKESSAKVPSEPEQEDTLTK